VQTFLVIELDGKLYVDALMSPLPVESLGRA
jgi:hypothetical protein